MNEWQTALVLGILSGVFGVLLGVVVLMLHAWWKDRR